MAQTKKQTPPKPTLQVLPPRPTNPPLEDDDLLDDDSPMAPYIVVSETSEAFDWLESIADLLRTADTGDLCDETVKNAAWLMQEIAEAGRACWRSEWDESTERLRAAGAIPPSEDVSPLNEIDGKEEKKLMRQLQLVAKRLTAVKKQREGR